MSSTIAYNGFDLSGVSPRGGRFSVHKDGFQGWHSLVKRRNREEKSQQAGAYPTHAETASLPVTVTGQAVYASDEMAALERRELLALVEDIVPVTVTDAAGTGIRLVETDSFVISPVIDRIFTYTLVVTACDPLLYGLPTVGFATLAGSIAGAGRVWPRVWPRDWGVPAGVTPGAVAVPNDGLAPYWPTLRIDGPVTNPVIGVVETGDTLTINATIPAGQWVDIDAGERHVTFGANADDIRNLTDAAGNWLAIPPGGATFTYSADSADAAATLQVNGAQGAWD